MLSTTNGGPFTQFDQKYYDNLKKRSATKAEEYRQEMTAPNKKSINLGAMNDEQFMADQQLQQKAREKEVEKLRKIEIQTMKDKGVIDLGIEGAVQSVYDANTITTQPTKTTEQTLEDKQEGAEIGSLTDAEANATPDAPIDLANLPEGGTDEDEIENETEEKVEDETPVAEEGYEIEDEGKTFVVTVKEINTYRANNETLQESTDEDIIAHMQTNNYGPFSK